MEKISKLTAEQEARAPEFRDLWIQHGLSTQPADRPAAEEGVRMAYQAANLTPPLTLIWCDSPKQGGYVKAAVNTLGFDVSKKLTENQVTEVLALIQKAMRGKEKLEYDSCSTFGAHEAGWASRYDFFDRAVGLRGLEPVHGLLQISRSCGWWWPYETLCVLTERHSILKRDARGRLHAEDGPAVAWPGGWGVWAWHGVRLPADKREQIILRPETLDPHEILRESNIEVRRVMIERYGIQRLIENSKAEILDQDDQRTLYRIPLKGDEPLVTVRVSCPSTGRVYFLRVPPDTTSAKAGVAWTFDKTPEEYVPQVET